MVQHSMRNQVSTFNKNILHSNLFLKSVYENNEDSRDNEDIRTFTNKIESYYSNSNLPENIPIVNEKFMKMCQQNNLIDDISDEIKYCRDMNYYLDLVTGIIKSSKKIPNYLKDKVIANVEQNWKDIPNGKFTDKCTRDANVDSIRKRCVLKHLHDLNIDKRLIHVYTDQYKTYLDDVWSKIIDYTRPQLGGLYIKIENDSVGIIEEYTNFLYSIDYICDVDISKLSTDDVTISTDMDSFVNNISLERISSNNNKKECYNKVYIDMLKKKTANIKKINNVLSSGIALLGFSLILILIYKVRICFSPLGSLLRRYTKKKIEVDENMNEEEMSELYNNSENEKSYISYYSISH
ncbi:unspecified product [Plasmodium ovale wallikeri]|uniref:Unspecified product n=1 Tax=Plasmodium ovale wallikeri TaxID=864142 RepID=A0A1A9AIP2_PLAOA|nr:unspecified product [Plasmodium ovale wallikeri]SBT56411.1 unspecified product [Plasmodium ovale wallikeri]